MFLTAIFTVLSALSLSVLAAPMPTNTSLDLQTYTGSGTWFDVGLGACGHWNTDGQHIVALSFPEFGPGYPGKHCGQWVEITANGVTAYGMVHDKCRACSEYDLDLSPSLFEKFAHLSIGRVDVSWHFV